MKMADNTDLAADRWYADDWSERENVREGVPKIFSARGASFNRPG